MTDIRNGAEPDLIKVMAKVKKLLELSKSNNEGEAANAAAAAQSLITEYKIDLLSVLETDFSDEPIEDFRHDPLHRAASYSEWRTSLATVIGKVNGCKIYLYGNGTICLVGKNRNVRIVQPLYRWMEKEIDRLAKFWCAGYGKTYSNNWKLGAVTTIGARLQKQQQDTIDEMRIRRGENPYALTIVNNAIAKMQGEFGAANEWANDKLSLVNRHRQARRNFNYEAYQDGQSKANQISLTPLDRGIRGDKRRISG